MKSVISKKSVKADKEIKAAVAATPGAAEEPDISVLRSGVCPSLSGKSELSFEWGRTESKEVRLRIVGNSGKGSFRQDWVDVGSIRAALNRSPRDETITSDCLLALFRHASSNMPSFVFAVLLDARVVHKATRAKRRYEYAGDEAFEAFIKALLEGKTVPAAADSKGRKPKGKAAAAAKPKNDKKSAKVS